MRLKIETGPTDGDVKRAETGRHAGPSTLEPAAGLARDFRIGDCASADRT